MAPMLNVPVSTAGTCFLAFQDLKDLKASTDKGLEDVVSEASLSLHGCFLLKSK